MSYTILTPAEKLNRSKVYAWIQPDLWNSSSAVFEGDSVDLEYFGQDCLRLETGNDIIPTLPVRITITGRKSCKYDSYNRISGYRCKIEFLNDGEESTFSGGIVYTLEYPFK